MKISYNWLREYLPVDLPAQKVAEYLTNTGLEVEGLEEVWPVPGGLKGVLVGEVLACEQHPNADRLKVTQVKVGGEETLQIVCGAPNVAAGQKVPVATPGTTLHFGEKPLLIKKAKLRGESSNGMICAEDELGLGDSHDGIMVLREEAPVGQPLADYFKLEPDWVFEIGLTPNRTDAMSHLGVARDLRAALLRFGEKCPDLNQPSIAAFKVSAIDLPINIEIEDPEQCFRYSGVSLKGVKVGPSPNWLQNRLKNIGLSPINNVVDVTNYVMHETGHPLHAFDCDKIIGQEIKVDHRPQGTKFTTLDGKERTLDADDLLICNESEPMVLAGVMGGLQSGVSEHSTRIFIEAAYFNPAAIRRSAKRHALNTDSSFRFERGVDPEMTLYALKRAALLISELAGGEVAMEIRDEHPVKEEPWSINLHLGRMNELIGHEIDPALVRDILVWLDFRIRAEVGAKLHLEVPAYRRDVRREADVIEEILRIYGFNAVETPQRTQIALQDQSADDDYELREKVSESLSARGFSEIINNSLVKEDYDRPEWLGEGEPVRILNPLSRDLGIMRRTLLFGGLENIAYNRARQIADLKLYEWGRSYRREEEHYRESEHLGLWLTGKEQPEQWRSKPLESDYYSLKAEVLQILKALGLENIKEADGENPIFGQSQLLKQGRQLLVELGAVKPDILKHFDLDVPVYYAQFNWQAVWQAQQKVAIKFEDLPRFPTVRRDLALLVDEATEYSELQAVARKQGGPLLRSINLFDVYEGQNLPEGKKSYALSFIFQDPEKTLSDKQVDKLMTKILGGLQKQCGAELR